MILSPSYLSNRRNRVKLNSVVSGWRDVSGGCPQGSLFGPLLWNIFQNDMKYQIGDNSISMYVDDYQLYAAADSIALLEQSLNNEGAIR